MSKIQYNGEKKLYSVVKRGNFNLQNIVMNFNHEKSFLRFFEKKSILISLFMYNAKIFLKKTNFKLILCFKMKPGRLQYDFFLQSYNNFKY